MRLLPRRLALLFALLLGPLGPIEPARAAAGPTSAELSRARALFKEARHLEDAGKWGEALERFQRVAEVKMTPQVRFHLALCAENVGLWTQALDGYALAVREARGNAPDVEAEAGEHLRKLSEIIPTVTLRVSGAARGDALYLDRKEISLEGDPPPLRVDPGGHTAELRRGAAVLARELFTAEPRSARRIELHAEPPPLENPPERPPEGTPSITASTPPPPPPPPPEPTAPTPAPTMKILGWAALGLGAASGVATGVFIGLRQGELDDLDRHCGTRTHCDPSVQAIVDRGTLDAAMVNVFGALTLASLAGGTALLLGAPSAAPAKPAAPRLTFTPALGPSGAGLSLRGRF